MSSMWRKTNVNPSFCYLFYKSSVILRCLFSNWWNSKNGDTNTIAKNEIIYGVIDNFARYPGLNLCIIIAKYYLYTASRKEEEFYFDAFLEFLTNKIKIEKYKSKSQINM